MTFFSSKIKYISRSHIEITKILVYDFIFQKKSGVNGTVHSLHGLSFATWRQLPLPATTYLFHLDLCSYCPHTPLAPQNPKHLTASAPKYFPKTLQQVLVRQLEILT